MDAKKLDTIRERAKTFAKEHVAAIAREVIEWQDTGLLCDGKLRELALVWAPVGAENSLTLAESTVARAALEVAALPSDAAQAPQPTRYFVHDNDCGYEEFDTDEERAKAHQAAIEGYLDDGWSEEVTSVVSGIVTHRTVQTDVEHRPPRCAENPEQDNDDCDVCVARSEFPNHDFETCCRYEPALFAAPVAPKATGDAAQAQKLAVWYGSMPESNGKSNWTAILHNGDIATGMTIDRSEYPDRVRYEADRMRWLIGEIEKKPFILDYDADKHSGYVAPRTGMIPAHVLAALDRMSKPLDKSVLSGATAEADAHSMKVIRDYVLSGRTPACAADSMTVDFTFLFSEEESLNELMPIEVLHGKPIIGREIVEPCQQRMLDMTLQDRYRRVALVRRQNELEAADSATTEAGDAR